ncbi:hypothetical protein MBLNU230_g0112t1 [Neophaeotheca triangularis]
MPMPTVSFLLGLVLLGYLLTFVVFAILRILTGVSIQRLGYSGFRRIAFSPRHGIKINVRGVGLSVHRPTFALPTWCSLVITELYVAVDLNALQDGKRESKGGLFGQANGHADRSKETDSGLEGKEESVSDGHGKTWRQLTSIKEKIKRLHRRIDWIKLVDFIAVSTTVSIDGVGSISMERATLSVDTRSKTMGRFFQYYKRESDAQRPAEWKSMIRSVLFTPEGRESTELLDNGTLNVSGVLYRELAGLRDASISLKLGRVNVPYDDIAYAKTCAELLLGKYAPSHDGPSEKDVSFAEALDELEKPGTREERIVQTVSDSREFIASILRGIEEVQLAFGFLGLSKKLDVKSDSGNDVYLNVAMKEMGFDVMRLDPRSPAHRMYFPTKDAAHQGLLTAIAISAGIDDGHDHPERMFYVPMVTATVKTTLPSKTIQNPGVSDAGERNTNMLFANLVCTSPSVDLDPKHLPLILEILKQRAGPKRTKQPPKKSPGYNLISRLLPKASVKFSIQEPVIRVSLPPMNKGNVQDGDYDLLITSVSTMMFDLDSHHSPGGALHYRLASNYRHNNHQLYYQTSDGDRHDLLRSDTAELKVDINAEPNASVVVSGRLQTFEIFLVRPDICEGVRQIVKQLRRNVLAQPGKESKKKPSFLRSMPEWLEYVKIEGSDFSVELAGVDKQVSDQQRGLSIELESWTTEYKSRRDEAPDKQGHRSSISVQSGGTPEKRRRPYRSRSNSPRQKPESFADGRRLTLHVQNLEGLILDSTNTTDPESFMSLPRFEVAFATSTDTQGPLFHVNSYARSLLLQYSLYNHYAIGVAAMVLKNTFSNGHADERRGSIRDHAPELATLTVPKETNTAADQVANREITTMDFKAGLLQLKAHMPADPPMLLQIFGLEAGRHRWATPFLRSRLARLCVRAPSMKTVWSRVISIKTVRMDVRDMKRRQAKSVIEEKSVDLFAEIIRIGIPHQLVVHSIFDNISNVIKTSKQLQHHFVTGTNEYVLTKEPEGPKRVPKITLRSQLFLFEIEDSSFEWKLNAIYRAGLLEQKQRLARDEALRMKEKHLAKCANRGGSRRRAKSTNAADRSQSQPRQANSSEQRRSQSQQPSSRDSPPVTKGSSRRQVRYNPEGKSGFADASPVSITQARDKLNRHNAQTWRRRIDRVLAFQSHAIRDIRKMFWGLDEAGDESEQQEPILALSQRPGLATVFFSDLNITVDKPSFPTEDYPKFLHDVGKGMPMDTQYSLLLPMNLQITTSEARIQLRDYPLPVLHVPPITYGQSARLPAMSLKTDFVIAEEFRDMESQRSVNVIVVPPEKMGDNGRNGFAVDVRRTISPVKTYSDMKFEIHTSSATRITWGTSYQPAIQDAMQVIEGFTKPPVDTSDRVGFWDKIRLSFHSRVNVAWKGDGDVHLCLKGSRDPYVVTGQGAGFVMVWRNNVKWNIAQSKDPRQFMTVDSGDYLLAVPDFSHYARASDARAEEEDSASSNSLRKGAAFKKVVMKLSGKVQWLAGMMFQRESREGRTFDFKNHYDVVLKHPDFARAPPGETYDAFKGFRSHHIHMSIAVAAPHDRDWSVSNLEPSKNYNSIHLSPRFFSHFFNWWSLFSGVMSLPIRQGPLWGVTEKKSKKFGRHVSTFKYNLLFSPLFISHIYKHKDAEDYKEDYVSATGLKLRLDSFMLDLHQRREHFDIQGHADAGPKKSSGMRINQAQLDFISADMRAVSATIAGTSADDIDKATDESLALLQEQVPPVDMSKFTIPDNDFTWIDMDDFVELDWILPVESNPETRILPLGYAPRFTYFRQTDHGDSISGDSSRSSPFGDELTHYCVMSAKNDPRLVQAELIQQRLAMIREQKAENERAVSDAELRAVRDVNQAPAQEKLETLRVHTETLKNKYEFLESILQTINEKLEKDDPSAVPELETTEEFFEATSNVHGEEGSKTNLDQAPLEENSSDFNNRFVVHNAQIKWNNSLRNIILRYIHQVSQRRGFVYYMSRRAVKFILDIVDEKQHSRGQSESKRGMSENTAEGMKSADLDDDATVQDRIEQLLKDGRNFVDADDGPDLAQQQAQEEKPSASEPSDDIAVEFTPLNTYHFRLIAPQIQLQSEKNARSAVLVTAKGMQLKVIQIMDKGRVTDDVSGLVQRRFTAAMDSLQMYVTSTKTFSTEYLHMYSGNRYGSKAGSLWPPWVPVEVMFEYQAHPYGFNRVVHRTSASLRYDKYNTLRLKYNDDVSGNKSHGEQSDDDPETHMDHVWLEFPQFIAVCDSAQYYAMYIIVMDLLLYNEPLEKTRSERLEKIMLASDFSDLTGAPEMVELLQGRIRQLEEIKMHFQVNERFLDRQGWKDRISLDHDLASCEDELFFMMKAITTSQQRLEDRRDHESANGMLHLSMAAKEIAWHLVRDEGKSLVEFQLKEASYDRTDNNDGSNHNVIGISRINGFNLLSDALYPEMIAPYVDESRGFPQLGNSKMLRVQWLMLEDIAGIPVVDYFEIDLVPLKLQLEREVAKKLFEYIFPGVGGNAFEGGGFSPFMVKNMLPTQEEEDEEDNGEAALPSGPSASNARVSGLANAKPDATQPTGNGAGALEVRLKPTLNLPKQRKQKKDLQGLGISNSHHNLHGFGLFQHSDKSRGAASGQPQRPATARAALSSSPSLAISRSPSERSLAAMSTAATAESDNKRFGVGRSGSDKKKKDNKETPSDDLTQMMNRASNYMTLAFVKVPSMVLCLSYKGKSHRNIEDVHDLVFRMPTLEYRNKTWSNLDLALQLKKDVIRALISHAGAIVGNKFSHHKPTKQQSSKLREIANMSSLMAVPSNSGQSSETSSSRGQHVGETNGRPSTASARPSSLGRTMSLDGSSIRSRSASDVPNYDGGVERGSPSAKRGESTSEWSDGFSTARQSPQPPGTPEGEPTRNRGSSISRRFTGLSQRLRQSDNQGNNSVDESGQEEKDGNRRSKLISGGQRLLRGLRD